MNFHLSNFTDVSSVVDAVRNISHLGGATNTTGGLRRMRLEIFNRANGDRPDVPNVAVLITDGVPTREVDGLDDEVMRIKNDSIMIVVVGITSAVSQRWICKCGALFDTNAILISHSLFSDSLL